MPLARCYYHVVLTRFLRGKTRSKVYSIQKKNLIQLFGSVAVLYAVFAEADNFVKKKIFDELDWGLRRAAGMNKEANVIPAMPIDYHP